MTRSARALFLVAAMSVLVAACGDDNKVGSDELTNFKEGTTSTRLGQTTTTAPPETTTTTGKDGTGTTAKATTTTSIPVTAQIKILPTSAGKYFDPGVACGVVNTVARWTNTDSVARGVSVGGQSSGAIPPGGTFDYRMPSSPTQVSYGEDSSVPGYRPFANAQLNVYPTAGDAQRCA